MEYNDSLDSVYSIENCKFDAKICRTNTAVSTAVRSFGHIQAAHVSEQVIEAVAAEVGRTPEEVRELNMYNARNAMTPAGQPLEGYTVPAMVRYPVARARLWVLVWRAWLAWGGAGCKSERTGGECEHASVGRVCCVVSAFGCV